MPSIVIHLEVGYLLSKKININSYNYYLGIIAPDSPNLYGFGKKEERWMAHLRRKDLNEWKEVLRNFYLEEKDKYNKEFLIGYIIHILTDIIYDDYFYKKIKNKIINDGILEEDSHNIMREDMDKYSFKDINNIINILKKDNNSFNINNISSNNLLLWKDKVLNNISISNNSKYIDKELIEELVKYIYREYCCFF